MGFAHIQLACEGSHSSILTEEMHASIVVSNFQCKLIYKKSEICRLR